MEILRNEARIIHLLERSCQRLERLCRLERDAVSPQHKARKRQLKVFKPDDEPT